MTACIYDGMKLLVDFAYPAIISFIFGYLFNELLIRSIF